jgi:hypothetical protein
MAIVDDLRSQGVTSVRTIAAQLNERRILTPSGGRVTPNVSRSVAIAVTGMRPTETAGAENTCATGPLLALVLPEMSPAHGFKNVE